MARESARGAAARFRYFFWKKLILPVRDKIKKKSKTEKRPPKKERPPFWRLKKSDKLQPPPSRLKNRAPRRETRKAAEKMKKKESKNHNSPLPPLTLRGGDDNRENQTKKTRNAKTRKRYQVLIFRKPKEIVVSCQKGIKKNQEVRIMNQGPPRPRKYYIYNF